MAGPATRAFHRVRPRLTMVAITGITLSAGVLTLTVVPPERLPVAAAAVAVLGAWRVIFTLLVMRFGGLRETTPTPRPWLSGALIADCVAVSACALTQRWIDAPYLMADGSGWVQTLVMGTTFGYPWIARSRTAVALSVPIALSYGAGASLAIGPHLSTVILPAAWIPANVILSSLVARATARAIAAVDEASDRREQAQAKLDVDAARRADEREQLAVLHDTAAATLLMVGLGTVRDGEQWLPVQAARDLAALSGITSGTAPAQWAARDADLVAVLHRCASDSGLTVRLSCPADVVPVPAPVVAAMAGAVGEALRNVRRHAGVTSADVVLICGDEALEVQVRDAGRGLPERVSDLGRGVRHSIVERIERAGGTATVEPAQPRGVVVRLRWPLTAGAVPVPVIAGARLVPERAP